MSKNILVVSVDLRETRVALVEDGIIAELHIQRGRSNSSIVGNVYLGKVTRVLPGLQAAFVDIGQERAAFLHVEDLIRPDDFDAYLSGGRKRALGAGDRDEELLALDTGVEERVEELGDFLAAPDDAGVGSSSEGSDITMMGPPSSHRPADSGSVELFSRAENQGQELSDAVADPELSRLPLRNMETVTDEPFAERDGKRDLRAERAVFSGSSKALRPDFRPRRLKATPHKMEQKERAPAEKDKPKEGLTLGPQGDGRSANAGEDGFVENEKNVGDMRGGEDGGSLSPHIENAVQVGNAETGAGMAEAPVDPVDDLAPDTMPASYFHERQEEGHNDGQMGASLLEQLRPTSQASPPSSSPESEQIEPITPRSFYGSTGEVEMDFGDLPGFTVSEPGDPIPPIAAAPRPLLGRSDFRDRDFRRNTESRRRPRTRARGRDEKKTGGYDGQVKMRGPSPDVRDGRKNGDQKNQVGRISKATPIREVVKEGQEIIVQVSKDPIGTKGARCTSHLSFPGRYVVYLPTVEHVGVSKRIGSERERIRLREVIDALKPKSGGLIVRTVAEGLTKKQLKQDVGYLVRVWEDIAQKKEGATAPKMLSSELDLVLKVARDLFTDEVSQFVIDDKYQYERVCRFIEMFAPERLKDVSYYGGAEPIFDAYGIEDEIQRALLRKVTLPSGGYLIIDQAEALTAIDVNTGRFVGKGSKDMEETILKTNLEAVREIAYQLRFRNIGGLIILDLIDMEKPSNREKVRRALEDLLQKDKAKTTLNRISDLGLIEMTRKRTRESLGRLMNESCFYCDGTGQLQSKESIAFEIFRQIRRKLSDLPGYTIQVSAHPAVADLLNGAEREAVAEAENRYMRKITVVPRKEFHFEQYDIQGK